MPCHAQCANRWQGTSLNTVRIRKKNNRVVALTSAICCRTGQGVGACNGVIVLSGNSGRAIKAVAAVGSMLRNTHSLLLRPAADKAMSTFADANCQQLLNVVRGCLSNPGMPGFRDRCKHNCNRYQKPMAGLLRGFSRRGRA